MTRIHGDGKHISKIPCPICEEMVELLTIAHLDKHGITKEEFLQQYPEYASHEFWGTVYGISKCIVKGCNRIVGSHTLYCKKHTKKFKLALTG